MLIRREDMKGRKANLQEQSHFGREVVGRKGVVKMAFGARNGFCEWHLFGHGSALDLRVAVEERAKSGSKSQVRERVGNRNNLFAN